MSFAINNMPGFEVERNAEESQVWFAGRHGETQMINRAGILDSAAVDSGNTPNTTIRGGAVLIRQTTKKYVPYGQTGKDGIPDMVLPFYQSTLNNGIASDRWIPGLVGGLLRASEIWNLDYAVAGILSQRGFIFDDPKYNVPLRGTTRYRTVSTTPITLTADDNGVHILGTAAGAMTINIPDPTQAQAGLHYSLTSAGAGGASFDTPATGTFVNPATGAVADTFACANGKSCMVECVWNGTAALWYVVNSIN